MPLAKLQSKHQWSHWGAGPDLRGAWGPGPQASHQKWASHQTLQFLFRAHYMGKLMVVGHQIGLKWNNEPSLQSIK